LNSFVLLCVVDHLSRPFYHVFPLSNLVESYEKCIIMISPSPLYSFVSI